MAARRKYRTQEPPFNVTFELTEGCNLSCPFCAVSAIQEKQGRGYKFMKRETMVSALEQIKALGWNCRIGFAMRGEPTMHPDYVGMVALVREYLPRSHITMLSNGGGLVRSPGPVANVERLFRAGLSVLGLDDYENVNYVPKIFDALQEELDEKKLISGKTYASASDPSSDAVAFTYYKYPEDLAGNPHMRRPRGTRTLVRIRDISAQSKDKKIGNHGKLFNYAGLSFPPDDSMNGKRCHHPFRQLAVHWDGNVPACCNSWDSPYHVGNVLVDGVEGCWQSNAMGALREKLYRGQRDFAPCKGCNHRSYRVGLLPDALGQKTVHKPDAQTEADIREALSHGVRSKVVRIPWKEREDVR